MSDIENIEIRVCLIGEERVGKKSIISRFKILNSSMTIDENKREKLKSPIKLPSKEEKLQEKNLDSRNTTKNKTLYENSNDYLSKRYSEHDKKKIMSLINFTKVLTISNFNIELKFFPISPAENLEFGDKINEEDEAAIRDHKMKFDNVKAEIEKVIARNPTRPYTEVKILFLFVIDLENYDKSFDKIKIYHDELNKLFNIRFQHHKALIGNKVDIKSLHIDRVGLNTWTQQEGLIYYEISTKMFFNFEKLFEKMFFEIFEKGKPAFASHYFKERFNYIMTYKPSFTRSERATITIDENPGPQKYDSNVYDLVNPKEIMKKEKRFNEKIFINKKGPKFGRELDEFTSNKKNSKQNDKPYSNNHKNLEEEKEDFKTAEKKRKLKEEMFGHHPGFTLGVKPAAVSIRKNRKEIYKKNMNDLENIFDLENITNKRERKPISRSSSQGSLNLEKVSPDVLKKQALKKKIEEFKAKRSLLRPAREKNKLKDSGRETSRSVSSENSFSKKVKAPKINKINKPKRSRSHRVVKKQKDNIPGPASYDIRGKIDISKGYTFGMRHIIDENKNNYGPGYLYLESDIEQIAKHPKFTFKSSAPRFQEAKIIHPGDTSKLDEYLREMEERRNFEKNKNVDKLKEWESKREDVLLKKADKDELYYRKLEAAIIRKEEKERNKRLEKGLKPIERGVINYNLVEETAPMFSMKGRYDKGFLGNLENLDDPTKLHGLEQSVSYLSKNLTKNLNPLPNYNTVKPNLPSFSMPRAERFNLQQLDSDSYYQNENISPYQDDIQGSIESKPGSYLQASMGLSKRFGDFKYSYIPGPGMYKLRGFADNVLIKAEKTNKNKIKIQEKLKTQDLQKSISRTESIAASEMMGILESENDKENQPLNEEITLGR